MQYGLGVGILFGMRCFLSDRVTGAHRPGDLSPSSRGKARGRGPEAFDRSTPQRWRAVGISVGYCGSALEKGHMVGSGIFIGVRSLSDVTRNSGMRRIRACAQFRELL